MLRLCLKTRSHALATMTLWLAGLCAVPVAAATPTCDKLEGPKKVLAQSILASEHPYDCCDESIVRCLAHERVCSLAYRLAENICRRVAAGQGRKTITRALALRARSMIALGKPATIALEGTPQAGKPDAPVELVEYACARCPFCAKITPKLHEAVVKGRLKGKVRLYFKPFPIRYHAHAKQSNLGLMAAIRLGKFWPFMQRAYGHFDAFSLERQIAWAEAAGMSRVDFEHTMAGEKTRQQLIAGKKEGLRNGVDATPTFFISHRRYVGDHQLEALIDALEEEYERLEGIQYRR